MYVDTDVVVTLTENELCGRVCVAITCVGTPWGHMQTRPRLPHERDYSVIRVDRL